MANQKSAANIHSNKARISHFSLCLGKYMLISYIITVLSLLLLAVLLYRFSLSEKAVSISIICIYIAASFLAGFLSGKHIGSKKYLWGLLMGLSYFFILFAVSAIAGKNTSDVQNNVLSVLFICAGAGTLGGMLA